MKRIVAANWDFPEPPLDPPESLEYLEADPQDDYIGISIEDTIIVRVDGEFEFEDQHFPWAKGDGYRGEHRGEETGVSVDDNYGVVDKVYDLLEPYAPKIPGKYKLSCDITLAYEISGIEYQIIDAWSDEDYGDDCEMEIYKDDAEAEYVPDKSTVDYVSFERIT